MFCFSKKSVIVVFFFFSKCHFVRKMKHDSTVNWKKRFFGDFWSLCEQSEAWLNWQLEKKRFFWILSVILWAGESMTQLTKKKNDIFELRMFFLNLETKGRYGIKCLFSLLPFIFSSLSLFKRGKDKSVHLPAGSIFFAPLDILLPRVQRALSRTTLIEKSTHELGREKRGQNWVGLRGAIIISLPCTTNYFSSVWLNFPPDTRAQKT